MSQIDINKTYRTREGEPVRIYAIDAGGEYPVHGAAYADGQWHVATWSILGNSFDGKERPFDLFEVKPRVTGEVWLNIYATHVAGHVYSCKEDADRVGARRSACIKIEYDVEEGEGL